MTYQNNKTPKISIVIVNYKVAESLAEALCSLREVHLFDQCEVIIVDNASGDNSRKQITARFPEIHWIQLKNNIGFGKACNVGARQASGDFLLLLNPDTVVSQDVLTSCLDFSNKNPDAGMIGPKILNPDGSLQASCRRSFPTPSTALFYFSGLSRLFPRSKRLGQYNLTYMDDNVAAQVDAISGSFMFMPLSVFREVGGFDEQFFMYGEDIDLCWRIRKKGYTIWYNPSIQIIHTKGKSSTKRLVRSRIAFYEAMIIFTKKYRAYHEGFFPKWLIFMGIIFQASINIGAILVKASFAAITDVILINSTFLALNQLMYRNHLITHSYLDNSLSRTIAIHLALSTSFLFMFLYNGVYSPRNYSFKSGFLSGILSSTLFLSFSFSSQLIPVSTKIAAVPLVIALVLVLWRETFPRLSSRIKEKMFSPVKVLLIGDGPLIRNLVDNFEQKKSHLITGIVLCCDKETTGTIEGYPVLGKIDNLKVILQQNSIDTIVIATEQPWYSYIIENIAGSQKKILDIRWVPQHVFSLEKDQVPGIIPLQSFS